MHMSSRTGDRRPGRLPLFRAHSPIGTSLGRRRRPFHDSLSARQKSGWMFLLVILSVSLIGMIVLLSNGLTVYSSSPMSLSSMRIRRWTPRALRRESPPLLLSLQPFLPDPNIIYANEPSYSQIHGYSFDKSDNGITVILPVTTFSLIELEASLSSILSPNPLAIREVIIGCHPSSIATTERAVRNPRLSRAASYLITVLPWSQTDSQSLGVLHILSSVFTTHVLILDNSALRDVDDTIRMMLLDATLSNIPFGPHGFMISRQNVSCIYSPEQTVPAAYLVPPFLAPTSLLIRSENGMRLDVHTWAALGDRIARISGTASGGLVISAGPTEEPHRWCTDATNVDSMPNPAFLQAFYQILARGVGDVPPRVNILFPGREDLESFGPTACEMARRGYTLQIMLFSWSQPIDFRHFALDVGCHLHFETISRDSTIPKLTASLSAWLRADDDKDALIYTSQTSTQKMAIEASTHALRFTGVTILSLPLHDLPFCEWMSLLSIPEWQNWHKPRIDLSVITNDRPRSLARLLASLTAARYYGDPVQLKINLEQTADDETRRTVADFRWPSGVVHVQHRIISAGLLPAVVEAWYPHTNDSYGVLLEDDVELSPMFYAWIKLAILRYRYGPPRTRAASLFGISLYQPTNLELRVEGRVPFEPRILFAEHELPDSRTPYLSQIPCSWGAVYFPEHFREFHDYLMLRLSEVTHDISEVIVPDIRSNRWKRSWKKYFNELVYLRGYVMLYPNYDASLATNHVEIGAHVKSDPSHILDSIKRQFNVLLMPLPSLSPSATRGAGLLDLPDGSLPAWDELPVLDFWGNITSHGGIIRRGRERHELLSACPSLGDLTRFSYDANELLCARQS